MVRLRHEVVAGIAGDDLVARIGRCTIRPVVVPVLGGDRDAPLADRHTPRTSNVAQFSIGEADVLTSGARQTGRRAPVAGERALGQSEARHDRRPGHAALEHDVDNPGDGVGPVLGGRTVAEDLDVVDGREGDGVQIHARRTAADAAVQVHERALVAPLAVDEDQDLIGPQASKRRRAHRIGAVGDRRPREVEGRRQRLNDLGRFGEAARRNLVARDDVDGNGPFGGASRHTRSDGDRSVNVGDSATSPVSAGPVTTISVVTRASPGASTCSWIRWAARGAARDLQTVATSRIGGRRRIGAHDRHHGPGHGKTVRRES